MINEIHIQGYKTLHDCSIKLGMLNVIIGDNMSGKTNLISSIELISDYIDNSSINPDKENDLVRALSNNQSRISIAISGNEEMKSHSFTWEYDQFYKENQKNIPFPFPFLLEGKYWTKDRKEWPEAADAPDPSPFLNYNMLKELYPTILCYKNIHTDADSKIRKPQPVAPFKYLNEDGSNLVNVLLRYLNDDLFRNEIRTIMKSINPDFDNLFVEAAVGNYVNLTWKEKYLPRDLYTSDLSDGTLRMLCLCTILLQNKIVEPPKLICIDEPELGLHPKKVLPLIADLIKSKSNESQIIISTHSPELLNHFELEDIITVRREKGKSIFERPSTKEHLQKMLDSYEYSISDLWMSGEMENAKIKSESAT